MLIRLRYATLAWTKEGCITCFEDGSTVEAHAHDTHHYHVIAHRLGYGDNVLAYAREHEFCHLFLEERLHNRPSTVLWALALGQGLSGSDAAYEEMAAQNFQSWLRANQRPIVSGVDWDRLKADALHLLEPEEFNLT